ncbi:MAG: VOC family protein [Rhodobacterales bacterium]|nr:VOC family protein [Rhodobacterales bacterium]
MLKLDHLAVSCGSLGEGREAVEAALGVTMQAGGKHAQFGTENMLLGLEAGIYLEVIAIDPFATPLQVPRWFDLDCFSGPPRLSNWICATDDMGAAIAAAPNGIGEPVALQRGDLAWTMAVAKDGKVPYGGAFPALIKWGGDGRNPARRLMSSNCALKRLVLGHPEPEALQVALAGMVSDPRVVIESSREVRLIAEISTPYGVKTLL